MEERLVKLNNYTEAVTSKKPQRSELKFNGRTDALNMKITTRMKSVNESVEDRPKNICLSKRARTSVSEFQAECQINGLKKKPVAMAKDVNFLKDSDRESDQFEKIRRLAAVEEGWDKKIKRKRSIGTILSRPIDTDEVPKRATQNRVVDERGVLQHDACISRSNNCDDSYTTCPSPLTKKKALRTTQVGWESAMAKERLTSQESDKNHKPSLSQWAGQRPPKLPRTRRSNSNLVSPVSNQDDFSPSKPPHRNATNGSLKLVLKLDTLQSETQESVGGERKTKGKMVNNEADGIHVQDIGPCATTSARKNKAVINEESAWRKGRSARGLLISRCSKSPMGNELDKSGCKKNDSKSGHRLKRLSEYKGLSSDAPLQNSSSPYYTGESGDDQEDMLSAASHAHIARSCSRPFLKKVESSFTPISSEEKSLLSQQVEERKTRMPRQQSESLLKKHDMVDETCINGHTPFYQRVLSALIIEEDGNEIDGVEEWDSRNIEIQKSFSDKYGLNDFEPRKKARVENSCGQSLGLTKKSLTEDEMLGGSGTSNSKFHGCEYEEMSIDEKLLLELQCIGLCPDTLPGLEENEDEMIPHENEAKISNRGKSKKLLLDNISGGTRGKRSARAATKPPRAPKPKPSQKTNLPPTHEGKSMTMTMTTTTSHHHHPTQPSTSQSANDNKRRDIGSEENDDTTPVEDLVRIDDELGDPHDLSSLLTFDEEDPQVDLDMDMDFAAGLAVPDDDLTELCIF
ncbi:unnamed protein product [Lactuca saligna]|uniref:Uncharacterized protein n=1 Tax=Lactuca saligna TaxID=75948 RepID=A0AA36EHF4_LACSI|nr:unnamed protein product [Lactuca saligna]